MNKRIKLILLLLLSAFVLPSAAFADNVTQEKAAAVAETFFRNSRSAAHVPAASFRMVMSSESIPGSTANRIAAQPAYYIFDNTSGPGFVIISGEDAVNPVLAYSFESDFPTDGPLPPNLSGWLEGMRREISLIRAEGIQPAASVEAAWKAPVSDNTVIKLETAKWNQAEPYNLMCPEINGANAYTGCGATAMAIVMRYHQWPQKATGTIPGYTSATYNIRIDDIKRGYNYDWDNMRLEYGYNDYSDEEATAVATLMRDCSISAKSDFGPIGSSGTSTYPTDILSALTTYMDYDKSANYIIRDYYSVQEWYSIIKNELTNNRPVFYTGQSAYGGHAFVLDGYTSDDYFSVNWGWGGQSDGYFRLDALDPSSQGAGGSDGGYNQGQGAAINVQKNIGGNYYEELLFTPYIESNELICYGIRIDEDVEQNNAFEIYAGLFSNLGNTAATFEILFALVDENEEIVEDLILYEAFKLDAFYSVYVNQTFTITEPILPGYRLRFFWRSSQNPEWNVVKGNTDQGCIWDMPICETGRIESETILEYDKNSKTLSVTSFDGVKVSLIDNTDSVISVKTCEDDAPVSFNLSDIDKGTYTLRLKKHSAVKDLTINL